jgi:hypothetical protein
MIDKAKIQLNALSARTEEVKRPGIDQSRKRKEARDPADVKTEDRYVVRIKVFNPENRTLYAYGDARRILYDKATGKLKLNLHDQDLDENSIIAMHVKRPHFVPLEANAETEIKLSLPKVINRILSSTARGGSGPISEQWNISEAKDIEVEIAHQDTPFYYDPKVPMARQLKDWGKAISKSTFRVDRPPAKQ